MSKEVFINLPVKDLKASMEFYGKLGFSFNPQFTDDKAACMIINEHSYAMLLIEPFFKTFTGKEISDATRTTEVLIALSAGSRQEVDDMVTKATEAGGKLYRDTDDLGFMYTRCFADPDGHQWEILYMDMSKMPKEEQSVHSTF